MKYFIPDDPSQYTHWQCDHCGYEYNIFDEVPYEKGEIDDQTAQCTDLCSACVEALFPKTSLKGKLL